MIRQGRLFHDMTLDYLRPMEPKSGSKVYLYFRCGTKEADKIFIIWESTEETREIVMRKYETEDQFDYYQTSVRIPKSGGIIYYYFRIESVMREFIMTEQARPMMCPMPTDLD